MARLFGGLSSPTAWGDPIDPSLGLAFTPFGKPEVDHRGKGPKGYNRSDEKIYEDICERLTDHPCLDAGSIEVNVSAQEVTLTGVVESRSAKYLAEDIAEGVPGVKEVKNVLRVEKDRAASMLAYAGREGVTAVF